MEINFSLFWGVAIQMYESTLIADQTPMDKYLEQQQSYTLDRRQQNQPVHHPVEAWRYSLHRLRRWLNPTLDASDQDIYSFDNGQGFIGGVGVNQGSIDYASGVLTIFFSDSPVSQVPIQINYSVGPTPMTESQLRGLVSSRPKAVALSATADQSYPTLPWARSPILPLNA